MQVRLAKLSTHVKILSGFCAQKWVLFQGFLLMSLVDDGLVAVFVQKTMARASVAERCVCSLVHARLSWGSVSRRFPHHFHFGGAA